MNIEQIKLAQEQIAREHSIRNVMLLPAFKKVSVNMGLGNLPDKASYKLAHDELAEILGQKPAYTYARTSVAAFKLREGSMLGLKATLRGKIMLNFLSKTIYIAVPRIRDFRGLPSKSFDDASNYGFGIKDISVFPELEGNINQHVRGLDISIELTTSSREVNFSFLKILGFPIR